MAMTLRLTEEDDAALAATAAREHLSKHEVALRALRAYTGSRQARLDAAIARVAERDAEGLEILGNS